VRAIDPALPEGHRWVLFKDPATLPEGYQDYRNPLLLNIGIGYPF
jgi:hypothetical protein